MVRLVPARWTIPWPSGSVAAPLTPPRTWPSPCAVTVRPAAGAVALNRKSSEVRSSVARAYSMPTDGADSPRSIWEMRLGEHWMRRASSRADSPRCSRTCRSRGPSSAPGSNEPAMDPLTAPARGDDTPEPPRPNQGVGSSSSFPLLVTLTATLYIRLIVLYIARPAPPGGTPYGRAHPAGARPPGHTSPGADERRFRTARRHGQAPRVPAQPRHGRAGGQWARRPARVRQQQHPLSHRSGDRRVDQGQAVPVRALHPHRRAVPVGLRLRG